MLMAKAHKMDSNQAGKRFAIVLDSVMNRGPFVGTYGVWTLCSNYDGRAPGGISKRWRYCKLGLTLQEAEELFARKIAGKQKP